MQYKTMGYSTKECGLESVKRVLLQVAQQATSLKAVNVQKGVTRVSNNNITAAYTKNKTRKW